MKFVLRAQLSCTAPRRLRGQQSGNCCTVRPLPLSLRQSPSLEVLKYARKRQRDYGPTPMVSAAVNMRVMVKLSVAKSSGKLDLSDCGLTEVPAEVCNIHDLEAGTCVAQAFDLLLFQLLLLFKKLIQNPVEPSLHCACNSLKC